MQFHAKYFPPIEKSYKEKENVDNKRKIRGFSYVMRTVFSVSFFVHTVIFIYYCNKKTVI